MDNHSKISYKQGVQYWVQPPILLGPMLVVGMWGAGYAAKSSLTKRYPPPGHMGRAVPQLYWKLESMISIFAGPAIRFLSWQLQTAHMN
jgi:hypothetical protein